MIPFVSLLPVLGAAFRLLAGGGKVDAGIWGSEVTNVLSALMTESNQTNEALTRLEAKIDDLSLQPFRHSFGAALNRLEEAMPEWREPAERDRLLAEARGRLNDALAAGPDSISRATVEWYLGVAWLLARSTRDCELAMSRAADTCLMAMIETVQAWKLAPGSAQVQANARALEDGFDRMQTWLFGGSGSAEARSTATLQARRGLAPYAEELEATLQGIQETRRTLGADPSDCPSARFGPAVQNTTGTGPRLIVDVSGDHEARLAQFGVGVGDFRTRLDLPGAKMTFVDAEILLSCALGAEPTEFRLAMLNEEQVKYWSPFALSSDAVPTTDGPLPFVGVELGGVEDGEVDLLAEAATLVQSLRLPGPSLMADGAHHPPRGRVRIQAGQTSRGWLRFVCPGKAAAIVVTPPGDPSLLFEPVHFLRSL